MAKVCSVEGCLNPHKARGFCVAHYARWRRTGAPTRCCETCGSILRTGEKGKYCSSECQPRCAAPGCEKAKHYSDGYCSNHHRIVQRHGTPVGVRKWPKRATTYTCRACGSEFPAGGRYRSYCSANCQQLQQWYGGEVPSLDFTCAICKCEITVESVAKPWRRRDKKICDRCRNVGQTRHKTQPAYLVERDGVECGICGVPVNMDARYPAPDCATVDHIIPVSLGGTHDEDNLQLAHWSCNHKKRNREGFTLT